MQKVGRRPLISFRRLPNTMSWHGDCPARAIFTLRSNHSPWEDSVMAAKELKANDPTPVTREALVKLLSEDLAREYQAIISYVVYSQVLKGAPYMNIAAELVKHATEELQHALIVAKQIDYLGGMPAVTPKYVRTSEKAEDMLRFD